MHEIQVQTRGRQAFHDVSAQVQALVERSGIQSGLCHLFCPHTTAGLTINENWDPSVQSDMGIVLDDLLPQRPDFRHAEGNSPAHIKTSLMGSTLTVFIERGRLLLGRWQGIYLAEFDGPRQRRVLVKITPDIE